MTSITITHTCGNEQEFELEPGDPGSWWDPPVPDWWYPIEPYCCELVEGDDEASTQAANAFQGLLESEDEDRARAWVDLEDLPK